MSTKAGDPAPPSDRELQLRHLRWGWWTLLAYLLTGLLLEAMHGFKVRWYFDVGNETRRLMLTLGHAHGTLLALIHLAFAASLGFFEGAAQRLKLASRCLQGSSLLLPGGFLLGGLFVYGGDPGVGIFLVPVGALLLVLGVGLIARDSLRS